MDIPAIIRRIDQKIEKLQNLKALLADSEMLEMVRDALGVEFPATSPAPITAEVKPRLPKGALRDAVVAAMPPPLVPFTAYDLVERMRANGFEFTATNPGVAVADVLRTLAEKGDLIRVCRAGLGSAPTQYERIPQEGTIELKTLMQGNRM